MVPYFSAVIFMYGLGDDFSEKFWRAGAVLLFLASDVAFLFSFLRMLWELRQLKKFQL